MPKSIKNSKKIKSNTNSIKSVNTKKVNCKDFIKSPNIKNFKNMICLSHKKEKTKCNNDINKIFLQKCKEKNLKSNNISNKTINCNKEVKSTFTKNIKDITCKHFSKKEKKICENSFKKSFFDTCNETQNIKNMKNIT